MGIGEALDAQEEDRTRKVLEDVRVERIRQESLKREGRFRWTCADQYEYGHRNAPHIPDASKLTILVGSVGRIAHLVRQRFNRLPGEVDATSAAFRLALRTELIQVAAIAAAWAESIS